MKTRVTVKKKKYYRYLPVGICYQAESLLLI